MLTCILPLHQHQPAGAEEATLEPASVIGTTSSDIRTSDVKSRTVCGHILAPGWGVMASGSAVVKNYVPSDNEQSNKTTNMAANTDDKGLENTKLEGN